MSSTDVSLNAGSSKNIIPIELSPSPNETVSKEEKGGISAWESVEYVVNIVNHFLIGFVTIYISWMCLRRDLKGTILHVWLTTIGFSFLMAEGVMTHYNGNTFLFFYKRKTKTTVHWILQAMGGILGAIGIFVEIFHKSVHFNTLHGKLGLAALILCGLSMISGLSALYSQNLRRVLKPLLNKSVHNCLGVSTLAVALVTQYYGFEYGFFGTINYPDFKIMMQVFTLMTLVLSCWGPLRSWFSKISTMMEN